MPRATTILTHHEPLRLARPINTTATSYPSRLPTITEPVSAGTATATSQFVHTLGYNGSCASNVVQIFPFGLGSDTNAFNMRVLGWRFLPATVALPAMWFPFPLAEFLCTLSSTLPGIADQQIIATSLFADTITLVGSVGNANISCEIVSPANDTMAHVIVDLKGCTKFEIIFDMVSATDGNAILALI